MILIFLCGALLLCTPIKATAQDSPSSKQTSQRTGIDPTDIQTRLEAAYSYNERTSGVTRHNINVRVEREFKGHGMNIRLDLPIIYADIPGESSKEGIGDIGVRINYRYKNTPGHSTLVGGALTLDTATEDELGDATTKITGLWINSWRRQAWLLSAVTLATWSESGHHDSAGVAPAVAYQPMKRYLSYVTVGMPVIQDLDDDETVVMALLRLGRVMTGGRVIYLGTRNDLSGNADDDLVITVGYRHLF